MNENLLREIDKLIEDEHKKYDLKPPKSVMNHVRLMCLIEFCNEQDVNERKLNLYPNFAQVATERVKEEYSKHGISSRGRGRDTVTLYELIVISRIAADTNDKDGLHVDI